MEIKMSKIITKEYSKLGKKVAGDYVNTFLKGVRRWSPEGIDYTRELQEVSDFRARYAKMRNLNEAQIIQGMNEISLAVIMYNLIETKGSCN